MCGIAGYYGSRELDKTALSGCLEGMSRRGPDYQATRHFKSPSGKNVYLLHSRLSIIDLDARSHQPFGVNKQWIVYNGELYNYLELKKDLARNGVSFTTTSDTEVFLKQLEVKGWESLDTCEGMWAIAHYDEGQGTLTLCRDRFGEKPLYLYRDGTGLYFGSEVKFIAALLGRPLPVNYDHLFRYLTNGYKSLYKGQAAFFKDLGAVAPGSYLRIDASGREKSTRYWNPAFAPNDAMSYQDAVAGVRERLLRSVELRLRADVPMAFCMSGGVDSNALISIAKRVFHYDVHGFTIVNSDSRYEENKLVNHAVQELGIRHTAIPLACERPLDRLRNLIRYHDAPVYTITYFVHWLLMESVAQHHYKISVSGTAADELFTGYYDHHLAYLQEIRKDEALHTVSVGAWTEQVKPYVRNPHLSNPDLFSDNPGFRDHIFLNAPEFAGYLKKPWLEPFQEHRFSDSLLRNRMLNEMFHEVIPVILHEDDLNAMYFSIENRSPFLDRPLFDFAYTIPTRHLIQEGRAKAVLRDAMRGIVPDLILDNPRKVGFNAPVSSFLDLKDRKTRDTLLDDSPIFDYVRRDKMESLMTKEVLPNSESKFLFYFVNSKIFLEEFAA